jgi:hypothetical protein
MPLTAARVPHAGYVYKGANHGFHNDTTPRYDEAAAKLAWQRPALATTAVRVRGGVAVGQNLIIAGVIPANMAGLRAVQRPGRIGIRRRAGAPEFARIEPEA